MPLSFIICAMLLSDLSDNLYIYKSGSSRSMGTRPSWLAVLRQPVNTDANNTDALVNFLNSKDGKAKHTDVSHINICLLPRY